MRRMYGMKEEDKGTITKTRGKERKEKQGNE